MVHDSVKENITVRKFVDSGNYRLFQINKFTYLYRKENYSYYYVINELSERFNLSEDDKKWIKEKFK